MPRTLHSRVRELTAASAQALEGALSCLGDERVQGGAWEALAALLQHALSQRSTRSAAASAAAAAAVSTLAAVLTALAPATAAPAAAVAAAWAQASVQSPQATAVLSAVRAGGSEATAVRAALCALATLAAAPGTAADRGAFAGAVCSLAAASVRANDTHATPGLLTGCILAMPQVRALLRCPRPLWALAPHASCDAGGDGHGARWPCDA